VLVRAAVEHRLDPLVGLKENVIIGRLIPASYTPDDLELSGATAADYEVDEDEASSLSPEQPVVASAADEAAMEGAGFSEAEDEDEAEDLQEELEEGQED
jgi:DNA-directed RNA polymerase subunit beta'